MSFGDYNGLVDEVVAFAKSDGLLQAYYPTSAGWEVIRDLEDAKRVAWDTPIGAQELLWTDLRELQMSKVKGATYGRPVFATIEHSPAVDLGTFTTSVRKRLDDVHRELLDDIVSDLRNCAVNRAVNGAVGFFEQLFGAYKAGGWPCGWEGNFPSGRLIVYFPEPPLQNFRA